VAGAKAKTVTSLFTLLTVLGERSRAKVLKLKLDRPEKLTLAPTIYMLYIINII
jgi:hypothetical protein